MNAESVNTGSLPMNESISSTDFPSNAEGGSTSLEENELVAVNHDSSTQNKQKKWVHQIVHGWVGSNNHQIASPPRPPSPTVSPPAWEGSSVTFFCINAFTSTTDRSSPTATKLLCRHCRCPSLTGSSDGNRMYERVVSYKKGSAVKVSFTESASTTTLLDRAEMDALQNCDQVLLCISMLDIWSHVRSEDGLDDSSRLWSTLTEIIREWKEELKDVSKPINVILLGVVKLSDGPTRDDYSAWFSSSSLNETMMSVNAERNMKWFTPILLVDKDIITPALTETPRLNEKRKLPTSWNQEHSVDFCFQSLIEQAFPLQKDIGVDINEAAMAHCAASEVNDPQKGDSSESSPPLSKKQRKENTDKVSPNSVVVDLIDLTTAVSADTDEDSPKVVRGKPSPVRRQRSTSKSHGIRNKH